MSGFPRSDVPSMSEAGAAVGGGAGTGFGTGEGCGADATTTSGVMSAGGVDAFGGGAETQAETANAVSNPRAKRIAR